MKDVSGWELDDYVVNRQNQEAIGGGAVVFTFPLVGDNNRWHVGRISVVCSGTGITGLYAEVRVEQSSDVAADIPPTCDVFAVLNPAGAPPPGYLVAAQNYPEGALWVPEDCRLIVALTNNNLPNGSPVGCTVSYQHLVRAA